jgi:hypothetical protein
MDITVIKKNIQSNRMGAAAAVFYCMDESGDEAESYTKRNQRRVYICLDWEQYWCDSLNDPSFERDIRMKRESFIKLVKLICDDVSVNREMAKRRGGDVSPELCLYLTIRYLSGGHYRDIVRFVGISPATFYYCLEKTMLAIINCPQLQIVFPTSDGKLSTVSTPRNVRSYFNGHYHKYGINVQACCDSDCMFTFFVLSAPGLTNDRVAIKEEQEEELNSYHRPTSLLGMLHTSHLNI